MKRKILCLLLIVCLLAGQLPVLAAEVSPYTLLHFDMDISHKIQSSGRYTNWAGVSTVSQFADEKGNYCFSVNLGEEVLVYKTEYGKRTESVTISNPYDSLGAVISDREGNLYAVWGKNGTNNVDEATIFVTKHDPEGKLLATVGGNGSEGMPYYYGSSFYTKYPFDAGNCDVAINGDLLLVNYAREMYSGHQSNTVFPVQLSTMTVQTGITTYNSHSFDQRITPYSKTGGFLLASHGDCYDRAFTTSLTNGSKTKNEMNTFHFWVEQGAFDDYDMWKINKTFARLGNVLETPHGAALVGASVRSLSEAAQSEPYDVFVQVFDPAGKAADPKTYVTTGTRSGMGGNNGDTAVTNYGVQWITDLAGTGKTADVVQAVSVEDGKIAVLYELYTGSRNKYDSTWYALLDGDGTVLQSPVELENVRLNVDEDPVYAQGAVQWTANSGSELVVYSLFPNLPDSRQALQDWRAAMFYVTEPALTTSAGSLTARATVHTDSLTNTTVYCGFYDKNGKLVDLQTDTVFGVTSQQVHFTTKEKTAAEAWLFLLDGTTPKCPKSVIGP